MPVVANEYTCREPGCGEIFAKKTTELSRTSRRDHENRAHLGSAHRTWLCPRDCGPLGVQYEEEALRAHMRRTHGIIGGEMASAWPGVLATHTRLVEAVWRAAETSGKLAVPDEAEAPGEADQAPPPTAADERRVNVYTELHALLQEWETLSADLEAAEVEIAQKDQIISQMDAKINRLEGKLKSLRDALAEAHLAALEILTEDDAR